MVHSSLHSTGTRRPRNGCQRLFLCFTTVIILVAHGALAGDPATQMWQTELHRPVTSSPALAPDGTIYVTSLNNCLTALDPAGRKKWSFRTRSDIHSSPALAVDGTIYFGSRDRNFYAVDASGSQKWVFRTGGWVDSSPAIGADGSVYFGSWDKNFYALSPTGDLKWRWPTTGPVDSSPVIDAAGTIYIGSHDHRFYALNPDGRQKWVFPTQGAIVASPAIGADGTIYVPSVDGNLYALNPDGSKKWQLHTGSIRSATPVIDAEGQLFVGINNSMRCITPDGHLRDWGLTLSDEGRPFYIDGAAAMTADGLAVFSSAYGTIYGFPTNTNAPQWYARIGGATAAPVMVGPDGTVYVGHDSARLVAFRGTTNLTASSWPVFRGNPRQTGRVGDIR